MGPSDTRVCAVEDTGGAKAKVGDGVPWTPCSCGSLHITGVKTREGPSWQTTPRMPLGIEHHRFEDTGGISMYLSQSLTPKSDIAVPGPSLGEEPGGLLPGSFQSRAGGWQFRAGEVASSCRRLGKAQGDLPAQAQGCGAACKEAGGQEGRPALTQPQPCECGPVRRPADTPQGPPLSQGCSSETDAAQRAC